VERTLHDSRTLWAFWIACGLTAVGAVAPLVLSGGSNRIGVVWAFGLAAVALGACAVLYQQGRSVVTGLYFVAGLAIVYGILSLIAVPLRLAVVGTCPPEPARCALGLERPLTGEETTALGFAVGMGIVGILTGFFALVMLYRGLNASFLPSAPPARRIAPVGDAPPPPPGPQPVAAPEPVAVAPAAPEAAPELDELPPPAEALELPAPTPEEAAEPNVSAPPPAAKPRRRRTPKPPPDVPTPPTSDS
jgi:MFS family permease